MKCVICKSEDIQSKKVDEEIRFEENIILFSIDVLVCNTCGERYYDRNTMVTLEEMRDKIKQKKVDIEKIGEVFRTRVA